MKKSETLVLCSLLVAFIGCCVVLLKNKQRGIMAAAEIEPDCYLDRERALKVTPRHQVSHPETVERLKQDMLSRGWKKGQPLLIADKTTALVKRLKSFAQEHDYPVDIEEGYETITGVHRLKAAIEADVRIPVVIIHDYQLTDEQWLEVLFTISVPYKDLHSVFTAAGLPKAAELMLMEIALDMKKDVEPTEKAKTEGQKFTVKRNTNPSEGEMPE